jgi:ADP-ribose pyrophosphatase YjhB (NUDIX family)
VAFDGQGRVLLVRRAEDGRWGLPGGGVQAGESWRDAAQRECLEETGWRVSVTGVFGLYSEPEVHSYPNGQSVHFVGVVFTSGLVDKAGQPDDEVAEVAFFPLDSLPHPLFAPDRPVLNDLASHRPTPVIS